MDAEETPEQQGWAARDFLLESVVGFAVAGVLIYAIGRAVGWGQTVALLRTAELQWVVLACVTTLGSIVVWARIWHVVLGSLGIDVPFRRIVVTFYAATFANYVTPFGQTGGQPFVALILARDTAANYEQSLASVITTDLLRMVPFFTAGGIGLAYLLVGGVLRGPVVQLAGVLLAVAVAVPLGVALAWRHRHGVRSAVLKLLAPLARRTDRISLESMRARFDRLYTAFGVIAAAPWALTVALSYAFAGWALFVLPLYFSGLALGHSIPILLVAFLVAATVLVGAVPLPGGVGAIEGSLVALLAVLTATTSTEAFAVTTVYRLTNYWLVVLVGGLAAVWVVKRV